MMEARLPSNSGKTSTPRESGTNKKEPSVDEEEGEDEDEQEEDPPNKNSCMNGTAIASCVFAMLMIVGGVVNLIIFIVYQSANNFPCYTLLGLIFQSKTYVGYDCGIGILAILILIPGILTYRIKDPRKTENVSVLSFISIFIAFLLWISEGVTCISMIISSILTRNPACVISILISLFVSLFGFVEIVLTIVISSLLVSKRDQAFQEKKRQYHEKKTVKKAKRDVVSAVKKKDSDTNKKSWKQNEEEESEEEDGDDDENEDEVGKNSSRGSDEDSESAEESETGNRKTRQTEQWNMKHDSTNTQTKHPSTSPIYPAPSVHPPVPRSEILCVPLGSIYPGYAANPYNQASMNNSYMWGQYQPLQFNGRVVFSPNKF